MIKFIAVILALLVSLPLGKGEAAAVIPARPNYAPTVHLKYGPDYELAPPTISAESRAWYDAYSEFTFIFDSIETKWSKNGRLMVKGTHSASFKFSKRSK